MKCMHTNTPIWTLTHPSMGTERCQAEAENALMATYMSKYVKAHKAQSPDTQNTGTAKPPDALAQASGISAAGSMTPQHKLQLCPTVFL
jgi:hypothetical protein